MIFFAEISFVKCYSYNNKHFSLLNASFLLNAPVWTHKVKGRPESLWVFIRSFTVNCKYIFFSALPECGWALGHVPSPSLVSVKVKPGIYLFNTSDLLIQ